MSTHFQMYPVDHLQFIVYVHVLYSNINKQKTKPPRRLNRLNVKTKDLSS